MDILEIFSLKSLTYRAVNSFNWMNQWPNRYKTKKQLKSLYGTATVYLSRWLENSNNNQSGLYI